MRCLYFRTPPTINELQACKCAPAVIGRKYMLPKSSVAHRPRDKLLDPLAGRIHFERRGFLTNDAPLHNR